MLKSLQLRSITSKSKLVRNHDLIHHEQLNPPAMKANDSPLAVSELISIRDYSLKNEKGTLTYRLNETTDEPRRLILFEEVSPR